MSLPTNEKKRLKITFISAAFVLCRFRARGQQINRDVEIFCLKSWKNCSCSWTASGSCSSCSSIIISRNITSTGTAIVLVSTVFVVVIVVVDIVFDIVLIVVVIVAVGEVLVLS